MASVAATRNSQTVPGSTIPSPWLGRIDAIGVDCVDASTQVLAHQGYTPTDKDLADLRLVQSLTS